MKGNIGTVIQDDLIHVVTGDGLDLEFDFRHFLSERRNHGLKAVDEDAFRHGNAKLLHFFPAANENLAVIRQDFFHIGQNPPPFFGEDHFLPDLLEKFDAEFFLHLLHLHGHRGPRIIQLLRRLRKRPGAIDFIESL